MLRIDWDVIISIILGDRLYFILLYCFTTLTVDVSVFLVSGNLFDVDNLSKRRALIISSTAASIGPFIVVCLILVLSSVGAHRFRVSPSPALSLRHVDHITPVSCEGPL